MKINLRPDLKEFVEGRARKGPGLDVHSALNYAVELLRAEDEWIAANADVLREEIAIGLAEAERGAFVEFDAKEIQSEGRRLLAARKPTRSKTVK